MIKLITFLALLGVSCAYSTGDWWSFNNPTTSGFRYPQAAGLKTLLDKWGMLVQHSAQFDLGVGTLYMGEDSNNADTQMYSYGVHLWSFATHHSEISYDNWYYMDNEVTFEPLYVAPYIQSVEWTRPLDGQSIDLTVSGSREVRTCEQTMDKIENVSVWEQSLITDFALPEVADFMPQNNFEHDWEDGRFSMNLAQKVLPKVYDQLVSKKIVGAYDYYTHTF